MIGEDYEAGVGLVMEQWVTIMQPSRGLTNSRLMTQNRGRKGRQWSSRGRRGRQRSSRCRLGSKGG